VRKSIRYWALSFICGLMVLGLAGPSVAEDLTVKTCAELVRIAEGCQQDLKTVDTVLGSAIDAGSMDRIRSYKLRKAEVKKRLKAVMRALEFKECVLPH
jgi:hypothetical protein